MFSLTTIVNFEKSKSVNIDIMLQKSLSFLTLLKDHNDKDWFHANKVLYDEARMEFEQFVSLLMREINLLDDEIGYTEPKDCIFRIFRDIRFSKDKTPYKTNFGAFVARGGNRKSEFGGYYFHLEPGQSMLAGGIWMPAPDILKAVREEIFHRTDDFLAIVDHKEFKKQFGSIDTDMMLKTAPRDYPRDWPHVALLKHKSYTVSHSVSDQLIADDNKLLKEVKEVFTTMVPFNRFFNRVIEDIR